MRKIRLSFSRGPARRDGDQAAFAHDVGRDPEGDDVRDVAGDVDIGPRHVEGAGMNAVAVRVGRRRAGLIGVVGVDHGAHLDRGRVVRGRVAGRRGNLCGRDRRKGGHDQGQANCTHECHAPNVS